MVDKSRTHARTHIHASLVPRLSVLSAHQEPGYEATYTHAHAHTHTDLLASGCPSLGCNNSRMACTCEWQQFWRVISTLIRQGLTEVKSWW